MYISGEDRVLTMSHRLWIPLFRAIYKPDYLLCLNILYLCVEVPSFICLIISRYALTNLGLCNCAEKKKCVWKWFNYFSNLMVFRESSLFRVSIESLLINNYFHCRFWFYIDLHFSSSFFTNIRQEMIHAC